MERLPTRLPGLVLLAPAVHGDARGFFMETYRADAWAAEGVPTEFVQDNHSRSRRGTLRGLHFQTAPGQAKLVRCARGAIFDVAVDIRRSSPTFGRWTGVELSAENRLMFWVPAGFAHGFATLTDEAETVYKCTTLWNPATDRTLLWNDPELGISWPVTDAILSEKDAAGKPLRQADLFAS